MVVEKEAPKCGAVGDSDDAFGAGTLPVVCEARDAVGWRPTMGSKGVCHRVVDDRVGVFVYRGYHGRVGGDGGDVSVP